MRHAQPRATQQQRSEASPSKAQAAQKAAAAPTQAAVPSITPTSNADCGAQISGQPALMQQVPVVALPASTASSCQHAASAGGLLRQPSGGPTVSSCGGRGQLAEAGGADAQSPPTHSAAKGGRRQAPAAAASRKRDRDDPLTKAIDRYMAAKARRRDGGEDEESPSPPAQRAQRPRTAGARAKSVSTASGTTGGSVHSHGGAPSVHQGPGPAVVGLPHGFARLQLATAFSLPPGAAAARGAAGPSAPGSSGEAGAAGPQGSELTAAIHAEVATAGQQAMAAVFAPLATLHRQYSSQQEVWAAQLGGGEQAKAVADQIAAALSLGGSNPWGPLPGPLEPVTEEELAEVRRQLEEKKRILPAGFKPPQGMPITAELFGAPPGTAGRARGGARAADSGAGGGGSSGSGGRRGGSKSAVAPYRLPVPLPRAAQQQQEAGAPRRSGAAGAAAGGRTRYTLRTARSKRKKDAGYVSFDSDDCTTEEEEPDYEEEEDEYQQSEGDAEIEDELDEADEDMSQPATARSHHRRPPAKQPRPGASDAVARVSVGRPRDKQPPGGNSSATAAGGGAPRTAREAAAAGLRSLPPAARAAAAAAAGGAQGTPKVAPLGATGLSPLLSPGLATLLSADAILAPAGGACMDVHPELVEDHQLLLGDFDFSNDALLAQLPRPNPSMLTSAALEASMAEAANFRPPVVFEGFRPTLFPAIAASSAPLLNPLLPSRAPGGAAVARTASAPMIKLNNAIPSSGVAAGEPGAPSRPASADASLAPGGAAAAAAAAAPAGDMAAGGAQVAGQRAQQGAGALLRPLLPLTQEKSYLLHALGGQALGGGGRNKTPIGSPLLPGLMSPTALGQLLDGEWEAGALRPGAPAAAPAPAAAEPPQAA